MGVLNVLMHLGHVYFRCCSISCVVCSWSPCPRVYSSIISDSFFLPSLSRSSSYVIYGCLAMSCIISIFPACLANLSSPFLRSPSVLRCCARSWMAWFRSSHCSCSLFPSIRIALRCFGCIVLVSCVCVGIVMICVWLSHDSISDCCNFL